MLKLGDFGICAHAINDNKRKTFCGSDMCKIILYNL